MDLQYPAALASDLREPPGAPVRLESVRRTFDGSVLAIDDLSLTVEPGEFVAVLGPSGCGKSTLLRLIAGLDPPDSGVIERGGAPGGPPPSTAFVFQDAHLLPWRDVLRNVALPLELRGVPAAEGRAAARAAIEQVGLADAAARYPAELSGGMRMRASLARALVTGPRLLLLDEPFAALDEITRQRLDDQLRALWLRHGMTVIFVTHSVAEAAYLAERAVILTRRPARLVADLRVELPRARSAETRTDPAFVRVLRELSAALERSDA